MDESINAAETSYKDIGGEPNVNVTHVMVRRGGPSPLGKISAIMEEMNVQVHKLRYVQELQWSHLVCHFCERRLKVFYVAKTFSEGNSKSRSSTLLQHS